MEQCIITFQQSWNSNKYRGCSPMNIKPENRKLLVRFTALFREVAALAT